VHYNGAKAQSCIVQFFCAKGGQSLLSLLGTVEKNFSLHFKRYNLTICAVNFYETFCTCSPSSLGQDPTVESEKSDFFFIWASSGRVLFGGFFEKNGLGPLGVKDFVRAKHLGQILLNFKFLFNALPCFTLW
jgi:hypothetical protein